MVRKIPHAEDEVSGTAVVNQKGVKPASSSNVCFSELTLTQPNLSLPLSVCDFSFRRLKTKELMWDRAGITIGSPPTAPYLSIWPIDFMFTIDYVVMHIYIHPISISEDIIMYCH